jgi:hypothetical protein
MIFKINGSTVTHPKIDQCVSTKRKALADLHREVGELDGKALARAAATEHVAQAKRTARYLREQLKGLKS